MLFHQRLQIDHGVGAVFRIVAEFFCGFALFQDALQNHAIERAVAHAIFMLDQVGFGVGGELNRLAFAHAVMGDQSLGPLLGPVAEGLFVNMGAPEFDDRAVLKHAPTKVANGATGGGSRLFENFLF